MRLQRVEIQGFRSFRELVVFDFTDQPGVVKLWGRNDDEPDLGANGAGKSSMWEAVYWCLFGAASNGLRGPELANWIDPVGIRVLVHAGGKVLVRTWHAKVIASLTLDGNEVTQDEVNAWLGISPEAFSHCSYIAQHASTFLDLLPSEKTDLLASVLNLDHWASLSAKAKDKTASLRRDIEDLSLLIATAEGALDVLEKTDYEVLRDKFDRDREARMFALQADIAKLNDTVERLDDAEVNAVRNVRRIRTSLEGARANLDLAVRETTDAMATLRRLERARDGKECPTCGRPWDRHRNVHEDDLHKARLVHDKCIEREDAAAAVVKKIDATLRDEEAAHRQIAARLGEAKGDIRGVLGELNEQRTRVNPYERQAIDKDIRVKYHRHRIDSMQEERDLLIQHLARTEYWINGFKDVRLFLVTEALTMLEVEVNSALSQLGLRDWAIKFAPDSTTKGGNVKRGFTVLIQSPSNQRPVPWTVWSGGEAQRLRVATAMGISNLIASYTGYQTFIEVWDEPSTGMSREGIDDLLHAFEQRALTEHRQLWVVDHRSLESGVFSETVTAVKRDGTTALEREFAMQGE